jgi:hypothetical protein
LKDQLGNPYQVVSNISGRSMYRYLPTGQTLTSNVTGISSTANGVVDQRFYPYALLSAAPGVYTPSSAPFFDADGVGFSFSPAAPINGDAPNSTAGSDEFHVAGSDDDRDHSLTEDLYVSPPVGSLQQQTYTI